MTDALQKLAALDKATSPGPWGVEDNVVFSVKGRRVLDTFTFSVSRGKDTGPASWKPENNANAQLASLSHLLLPAFEALEKLVSGSIPSEVMGASAARTVLAQLEEALEKYDAT